MNLIIKNLFLIRTNVKYMSCMFFGCKKLNKNNIITKDERILNEFDN